ncbi:LysR family transcriptional regulator [Ruania zhangjianzhongii]|uniref:LysR family transcriptional regulator n=1 Tax=Ruania zhangjianzhongii TaxID=2603206 RepID=UPI0011CCBA34|nr:LysR family transcriptional regulator [Ruania zhangjianzhongii]
MANLETRELRYFVTVAEELHFRRAADRLGIAQPPLSRAISQLERRLGVQLLERDRRRVTLTDAGTVLLSEARTALDAISTAAQRTQRAGASRQPLVLATKAGASHELLQRLLDAVTDEPALGQVEVQLCEVGEQAGLLRSGTADVAIMHKPVDDLVGFDTEDLYTEGQVVIVPAAHPFVHRSEVVLADVQEDHAVPMARWPRLDGTYPDGPGPEVRTQSQIAQLVALAKALLVIPASSRAWQWPEHVAVPVTDAPRITTVLAWPAGSRSSAISALVRVASGLSDPAPRTDRSPSRGNS